MDKLVIRGGRRLQGEVVISGAKNAALPLIAASLLGDGESVWHNVPRLGDVRTMGRLLEMLGARVEFDEEHRTLSVDTAGVNTREAPYHLVRTMRASVLVLGPLLARYGEARVSLPGGCAIGARPIDIHLKGLEAMGADIELDKGYVVARARKLKGANILCRQPTVGGTENLMMAACLAEGRTIIENAAREPEVEELAKVLNKMGANIEGAGTGYVSIEGVGHLHPVEHAILPDRIESGTFMIAAAITGGDVVLRNCLLEHNHAVVAKLRDTGAQVDAVQGGMRVRASGEIRPVDIITQPYPGFPTDMQAQFMALATQARGDSVITESIFENRFMHVSELARMGANIVTNGRMAVIRGRSGTLQGTTVMATDLRASACLVLAGLVAENTTEVLRVYHLDRGYEALELKLRQLGADVTRAAGAEVV
ncbi:MAG: UDP-N-acetylglucosamine 1-carboxyvinyltransferase [Polyangia bacterium]|jgi:UDP-N-acetylglucosamine 1-carboxyvinyltransferase|nr:UDP-N-acetylglucosamine 1-carboxyvinyltransferase [Polyangia bacterium]